MVLIVTDENRNDVAALEDFILDLEYGSGDNDFEATLPAGSPVLHGGELIYIDGTPYGGIVDEKEVETGSDQNTYTGRTWHGVLAGRVVVPPQGSDRYSMEGEANSCIRAYIGHLGLGDVFSAPMEDSGIELDYQMERFCDGWSGLFSALKASGARPNISYESGYAVLSAVPARNYGNEVDSDLVSFAVKKVHRCVNHLVCAGAGEGQNRVVVHFYADEDGNVSETQSLFGVDQIDAFYDYTNADEATLKEEGRKKLEELQTGGEVDVDVPAGTYPFEVGDTITGRDNRHGVTVTAEVSRKIVKVSDGSETVDYDVGKKASSKSISGSAESSGGGISYSPGKGISITGGVISAEVDENDLEEVDQKATNAYNLASNAGTEAAEKVASVEGTAPIKATEDADHNVTVEHLASGVTAGSYGPTANPTPGWGDEVTLPPQVSIDEKGHITGATPRKMTIPDSTATQSADGLMAKGDKAKLDGVESGATKTEVDGALSSSSANPVANSAVTNALNGKAPASHDHSADDIAEGVIPASRGGTGVSTAQAERNRLGLGNTTGAVPVANGGTGATTAAQARTNLGVTLANLGVSATAAELNKLDGATVTTDEINCLEGVESDIQGQLDGKAPSSHTHKYAGSSSAGGAATSAEKLKTARKITFTGAATGNFTFDGSKDVTVVLEGDSEAAGFLAAHPVGSYFLTSAESDPGLTYGGEWVFEESLGPFYWRRIA